MATSSLPYDIVGHIIDILAAEGDLTPVKNASLASSSVLHLCRRHIFHTISSYSNPPYQSLKKPFINLLVNNPAIVQYIRDLEYEVHHDDNQLSPFLPNLLHTISHLECLRIRSINVDWSEMDPLLRSTLLHLMYLPTVTHFVITRLRNIPISAFAPCINLQQLDIRYITLAPFEDQSPSLRTSRPETTPRILHFRNVSSQTAVERLLRAKWKDGRPVLDFSHLKTLVLDFNTFQDVPLTQEIFENASYLEDLQINGMFTCQSYDLNFESDLCYSSVHNDTESLAGLSEIISVNARNLRTLQVMTLLKGKRSHTLMIGLCEELKTLAGNEVLQVLKFTFSMEGCESKALVENAFRKLEEVLMDPGWSTLVCVSINIVVRCCYREVARLKLNSVPEKYFGRLSSRKILSYKWEDFVYNSVE